MSEDRKANQTKCFGMTVDQMTDDLREQVRYQYRLGMRRAQESADAAREVIVFSMLSNVQEEISVGQAAGGEVHLEHARQMLNVAKWILGSEEAIAAAAGAFAQSVSETIARRRAADGKVA